MENRVLFTALQLVVTYVIPAIVSIDRIRPVGIE